MESPSDDVGLNASGGISGGSHLSFAFINKLVKI